VRRGSKRNGNRLIKEELIISYGLPLEEFERGVRMVQEGEESIKVPLVL